MFGFYPTLYVGCLVAVGSHAIWADSAWESAR